MKKIFPLILTLLFLFTCANAFSAELPTYTIDTLPADYVILTPPTCSESGLAEREVDHDQVNISPLGHIAGWVIYSEPTCTEEGALYKVCLREDCGAYLTAENVEATEEDDINSVAISALGHTLVEVDEVPATHLFKGYEAHMECSVYDYAEEANVIPTLNGFCGGEDGDHTEGEWILYEDTEVVKTYTGLYEFEGARFYLHTGKLVPANGLTLVIDEWYFLSEGRVITDSAGFVEYNGAWFIITDDGVLDDTVSGLTEYNDGYFIIADGRLVNEYTGLWQDPETGAWIYIVNGQFESECTGLVSYDDEIFYVRNGILAIDFSGIVKDHNNNFFVVKNGMVRGR